MTYKKIYMTFNIKRHMHARVIFRWVWPCAADLKDMEDVLIGLHSQRCGISLPSHVLKASSKAMTIE